MPGTNRLPTKAPASILHGRPRPEEKMRLSLGASDPGQVLTATPCSWWLVAVVRRWQHGGGGRAHATGRSWGCVASHRDSGRAPQVAAPWAVSSKKAQTGQDRGWGRVRAELQARGRREGTGRGLRRAAGTMFTGLRGPVLPALRSTSHLPEARPLSWVSGGCPSCSVLR